MSDTISDGLLPDNPAERPWFFCGIGGSGMLPLATILKARGAKVAGSDRSFDQGRTPEKFAWLENLGFELYPQDGSGITSAEQILVASAAIEDSVPEMVRASELGCPRVTRAQALAHLFNRAVQSFAVGGTSGKSTVTGMLGWIMTHSRRDPTIMNGAVMKNFITPELPFASSRIGQDRVFISEVDESDGSIALFRPTVSVLLNVSLDHKSMEELRALFGAFVEAGQTAIVNFDDQEARDLAKRSDNVLSFGVLSEDATFGIEPDTIIEDVDCIAALVVDRRDDTGHSLRLNMPGQHNLSNALAAIAAAAAAGVPVHDAAIALGYFTGLARRFDIIGRSESGIVVIDDFGHNPEKCRATLRTLKAPGLRTPGRVIAFFQPHGYGPLRQIGDELARTFATELDPDDVLLMCDPVYFGGTVDRSEGSERIIELVGRAADAPRAEHLATREECADRIVELARAGDRVAVMGARDDTLTDFARGLLARLP